MGARYSDRQRAAILGTNKYGVTYDLEGATLRSLVTRGLVAEHTSWSGNCQGWKLTAEGFAAKRELGGK